jgi:hypothetical protein
MANIASADSIFYSICKTGVQCREDIGGGPEAPLYKEAALGQ